MSIASKVRTLKEKLSYYCGFVEPTVSDKRQMTKLRNKISALQLKQANHSKVALKNRDNGTRFEFKILRKEKRNSLLASRSAGSHSLIDITSIKKNGEIWLYSLKCNGYWEPNELNKLRELKKQLPSNCKIKLASYKNKRKYVVRSLK